MKRIHYLLIAAVGVLGITATLLLTFATYGLTPGTTSLALVRPATVCSSTTETDNVYLGTEDPDSFYYDLKRDSSNGRVCYLRGVVQINTYYSGTGTLFLSAGETEFANDTFLTSSTNHVERTAWASVSAGTEYNVCVADYNYNILCEAFILSNPSWS